VRVKYVPAYIHAYIHTYIQIVRYLRGVSHLIVTCVLSQILFEFFVDLVPEEQREHFNLEAFNAMVMRVHPQVSVRTNTFSACT
jgi:hypothetical protein